MATQEYGHLEALGATLAAVQRNPEALWPADVHRMPSHPAFDGLA